MTIPETIKYITKLKNKEIRTDSKKFKAYLNDLSPECVKELKLLNRALNDNILSIIFSSEQDSKIISKLTTEFKNMGMPYKQMNFILKSFAEVLGWNYTPTSPKQETPKQEDKTPQKTKEQPKNRETVKESVEDKKRTRDTEKKIKEKAPSLLSFVKPLITEVKKKHLEDINACVVLVMDISNSMRKTYADGTVQEIVNKILPIAVQFDEEGELDFWYYGSIFQRRPPVSLENYKNAVPSDWEDLMSLLGGGTEAQLVMQDVMDEYEYYNLPVYVIFITDGGFFEKEEMEQILIDASKMPIFWQFVGIGKGNNGFWGFLYGVNNYNVLKKLDKLEGRYVDNTGFFAIDDFRSVSESELYSRLLDKFPSWLKEAKSKNIFNQGKHQKSEKALKKLLRTLDIF